MLKNLIAEISRLPLLSPDEGPEVVAYVIEKRLHRGDDGSEG